MTTSCRIIKLGGSLLDYEPLIPALRDWLSVQPPALNVLVVGGGRFVDLVRDLDARLGFDVEKVHWLCIRLLDVTSRMVSLLLPEAEFIDRYEELCALQSPDERLVLFSAEEFLQRHEPLLAPPALPANWSVTSDSIAARLAVARSAMELVLLKSADPPELTDVHTAAQIGYVDHYFPIASQGSFSIRCVNLRNGAESVLR